MRAADIIQKKRDGQELSADEITWLVHGFTRGEIPDYQMSAFLMAVYFRGMTAQETASLTLAMLKSGDQVDLSPIAGRKVDKHSTGGVGDTTTLVLAPLVAAAGVPVAKMSGRALGFSGGTIDKLESIPGFQTELSLNQMIANVNRYKVAVVGQTGNLVPADKKMYALRDVTATVESVPLIASSIMSKKLAAGADGIVLDVKTGEGAFMKTAEEAFRLAEAMVQIGHNLGRHTVALVTDMSEPLGRAVGNALEVAEAIATLQGHGPDDLAQLCLALGSEMLLLAGAVRTRDEAREKLEKLLKSGQALAAFRRLVQAQGGNPSVADDPSLLPQARWQMPVPCPQDGWVEAVHAETVGRTVMLLGAGRARKEDAIDHAVGVVLAHKVGDQVRTGETLATVHANDEERGKQAVAAIQGAFRIGPAPVQPPLLIQGRVSVEDGQIRRQQFTR